MIVPSNRLLFWVAALLPLAALAGLVPAAALATAACGAILAAVAAADAARALARRRLVSVSLPPVVRLSISRPGAIPVTLRIEAPAPRAAAGPGRRRRTPESVTLGVPLPAEFHSDVNSMAVSLPADEGTSSVDWPCVPRARGSFRLERCHFGVPSPLGLWSARGASDCRSELRVYPELASERRALAAFFLNRGSFGLHTQRTVGQGREFEKLRDYVPGDSFDDIHWKATAKRGRPVTKLFQIEKTQEVYVLLDASRMSGREIGGRPVLERFIASALVLALAAERQGDLFGLAVFDSRVRRFLRARRGKAHFDSCRDALYTVNTQIANPGFDEMLGFVRLRLRRRSLLVILTDLGDPLAAESLLEKVDLVCRQHVVLVFMVRQPGIGRLFEGPAAGSVDDVYRDLAGHMMWKTLREVSKALERRGVRLSIVDDAQLSAEAVSQYLNVKARQLL